MAGRHGHDVDEYKGETGWSPPSDHAAVVLPASSLSPISGKDTPSPGRSHSSGSFGTRDSADDTGSDTGPGGASPVSTTHGGSDGDSSAGRGHSGGETKGVEVTAGGEDAATSPAAPDEPTITDADFVLTPFQVHTATAPLPCSPCCRTCVLTPPLHPLTLLLLVLLRPQRHAFVAQVAEHAKEYKDMLFHVVRVRVPTYTQPIHTPVTPPHRALRREGWGQWPSSFTLARGRVHTQFIDCMEEGTVLRPAERLLVAVAFKEEIWQRRRALQDLKRREVDPELTPEVLAA